MPRRKLSILRMSLDAAQASQDAAVTIAARLPMIAKASRRPGQPPNAELQGMVSEKMLAAAQGSFVASLALGQFWTRALFGGIRTPMDAAQGLASVAEAAMRPARKRVRANAKRLSRKRG